MRSVCGKCPGCQAITQVKQFGAGSVLGWVSAGPRPAHRNAEREAGSGKREAGSGKREEEEHRREWLRWHSQEGNLRREESERKKGEREGWHMYTQGHSRTGGTTNNKNKNISNVWFIFFQLYWPWKKKPENHKRLCSLEVCNPLTFGEHNGSFWPILRL